MNKCKCCGRFMQKKVDGQLYCNFGCLMKDAKKNLDIKQNSNVMFTKAISQDIINQPQHKTKEAVSMVSVKMYIKGESEPNKIEGVSRTYQNEKFFVIVKEPETPKTDGYVESRVYLKDTKNPIVSPSAKSTYMDSKFYVVSKSIGNGKFVTFRYPITNICKIVEVDETEVRIMFPIKNVFKIIEVDVNSNDVIVPTDADDQN